MGLDVYVGSLTRYYSGQWETIVQRSAREDGIRFSVVRPDSPPDALTNPADVEPIILAWRTGLQNGLAPHGNIVLNWSEQFEAPYFTDKPAWDCYAALVLWAAYDEHPETRRATVAPDDWSTDPAYKLSIAPGFRSRYSQLISDTEMWLPVEFDFIFMAPDPAEKKMGIGSSSRLLKQLNDLNQRTWQAGESTLADWRRQGADHGAPLETSARFGFAIMFALATESVRHALPMKLDY